MGLLPFPAHVRYAIPVFISAAGPSRSWRTSTPPSARRWNSAWPGRAGQGGGEDGPLLVIAGAGSGKTNTLAHRVAHLILNGADPQRMLLLTFSRRAALEMERRVGAVLHRVMRLHAAQQPPACPGRAPSMPSARACCAIARRASACPSPSPSWIGATPRT